MKALFFIGIFSLLFALTEVYLNLVPFHYRKIALYRQIADLNSFTELSNEFKTLYEPRQDSQNSYNGPYGKYQISINSLGLRGKKQSIDKEAYRILVIGGSNAMGANVNDNQTWPYKLEVKLNSLYEKKVQVFNASSYAFNLKQKVFFLEKYLSKIKPDLILFQHFYNYGRRPFLGILGEELNQSLLLKENSELYFENVLSPKFCKEICKRVIFSFESIKLIQIYLSNYLVRKKRNDCGNIYEDCDPYIPHNERLNEKFFKDRITTKIKSNKIKKFYFVSFHYQPKSEYLGLPVFHFYKQIEPENQVHPPKEILDLYSEKLANWILKNQILGI